MNKPTASKTALQGVGIGVVAALVAGGLFSVGWLDWLERPLWDWRASQMAKKGAATESICSIMIDQASLDAAKDVEKGFGLGWPWPRQVYAYILDFCRRAEAKAVIFDILYTEHSTESVADDEALGEAIARGVPFVIALPVGVGTEQPWPETAAYRLPMASDISGLTPEMIAAASRMKASFPIPPVSSNATILANIISEPDKDAIFRRLQPFRIFDNRLVPSLGLAAVMATTPDAAIRVARGRMHIGSRSIPLDRHGAAILRFRGRTQTHKAFNAYSVLQSEYNLQAGERPTIDPAELKGKYVIVGMTAPALMDLKPTPMGKTYPGMEIHATFLDNLLSGDFIRECPTPWVWLGLFAIAILAGITVRCSRRSSSIVVAFASLGTLSIVAGFIAYHQGLWLPVAPLISAALLAMVAAVIVNYAVEGRQKRFIKGAFKQYLSPIVIEKLMENPDQLKLGGEEKVLTIFFSDVQGFTSISEKLSPTQLTGLLNEYLTAMTDIIYQTGGTIDKYEGDAIIAFWNAPLEQADHAEQAVRAALQCQAKLDTMRADLNARYGSNLYVRIGINTGPVVIGNMGSNQRFNYTFLGDAGNLAARLEGINKQFGTFLMISHNTRLAIGNAFPVRELSRVRVVGKAEPITIFEPMLPEAADARREPLAAFQTALETYYAGDFTRAQAAFAAIADDPVAAIYAKRCTHLADTPHPDWDGIWNIGEK
jgi:adenylate cyclase